MAEVPLIEFERAGVAFGATPALEDISLIVEPGAFLVLTGPAAAGKSTLLRLCHLDLAASSGRTRHFGRRIFVRNRNAIADARRRIGMVHQTCRFLDHLTLVENIALPIRATGGDAAARAEDIAALLEWVELTDRVEARPPALSDAERRRAAVARAVVLSPDLVLADEPVAGLDAAMARRLIALLAQFNRLGKAVVLATRDPEMADLVLETVDAELWRIAEGRLVPVEAVA